MTEGISSRITRLNQLLSGKTHGKKVPLLDKDTLLDAFVVLYNECNNEHMRKDKNISTYVKKFKPLICEIEKLRLRKADFEIRKTIGRGHFGEVHVVREKVTGDVYAMKVLKKSETLSQDNVAFFEEERDIMAFAGNPWITCLQYAFQDYESLYLVMDFHPGGDLLSLLAKYDDIFEEDVAKFYLGEMIMALHAVHALGYVHRDIKPENVLVDRTGHIKLADFGSSAKLSSAKMVVSKMPVGTPEYIAPEVLMSMDGSTEGKYGAECDWWSLGVVAYEMMVGETPFQADSVVVVYSKIMDFKNSLTFPEDEPLSENAIDLIRALLNDRTNRIGYEELAKHSFFTGLDWTTLKDAVPPYVPSLNATDDTSNFDDFETEQSGPRIEDFMGQKSGFQGKDLPFIGFTFTKQLTMASLNESSEGIMSSGSLSRDRQSSKRESVKPKTEDSQLAALKVDIEKEQKKVNELRSSLNEKVKQYEKVENERNLLENEKVLMDSEIKELQRNLDNERASRTKAEGEALKLLKEIQDVNRTAEEMRDSELKSTLEEQKHIVVQLEQERSISNKRAQHLESQANELKESLEQSKTKISELQTKLAKVNEDTKSNVSELQLKLQKVTTDSEARIKQFQEKLLKAMNSAQEAVDQLAQSEKEKEDLKELLDLKNEEETKNELTSKVTEQLEKDIHNEISKKDSHILQLEQEIKKMTSECDESKQKYDGLVEYGNELKEQLDSKIEDLEKRLSAAKKDSKKIEQECKQLREESSDKSNRLDAKEVTIDTLRATITNLETEISSMSNEREMSLKERDEKAEDDRQMLSRQVSQISQDKINLENEVNILKLDIKNEQQVIAALKKRIDDQENEHEENTDKLEETIAKLKKDLSKMTDESTKYQKEFHSSKKTNDSLNNQLVSMQIELEKQLSNAQEAEKVKDYDAKIYKLEKQLNQSLAVNKTLESKTQDLNDKILRATKEKEQMNEEVHEKERQAASQDLTIQMLKSTCTMLEGQVEELEIMNDEYQDRETQFNSLKRQHYQQQEKMEQQLTETLNSLEQQRLLRLKAEEKARQSEDTNTSSKSDMAARITDLEETCRLENDKVNQIRNENSELQRAIKLQEVNVKNLERKIESESDEKNKLQEEIYGLKEYSQSQTASNFAMKQENEDLNDMIEELQVDKENLQNQIERTAFSHAEEKIKIESTLAQQTKLIDFLQQKIKIEDPKNKKKFKAPKSKANEPQQPVDARKMKDLEKALEKEKNANLQLHLQMTKAREELQTVRAELTQTKAALRSSGSSAPTTPQPKHKISDSSSSFSLPQDGQLQRRRSNSPSTSVADLYNSRDEKMAGIRHDSATPPVIVEGSLKNYSAHKLQATLNMRPTKCPVCLNSIHFGKQVMKCSDCHQVVHNKCAPSLPNNCGVTDVMASHFSTNLKRRSMISDDTSLDDLDFQDSVSLPKIEGWLKYPRKGGKQGWERKWIVLEKKNLSIYDNQNTIEFDPAETVDLNILDGELNVHPAIPTSELIFAASTDIPYVMSLEMSPHATASWSSRVIYFMAPTFSDKQQWVSAFEFHANQIKKATTKQEHDLADNVLMQLNANNLVDVNCAVMLQEEFGVLGAEEGLFVSRLAAGTQSRPVEIVGLGNVYQLQLVEELGQCFLIAGRERVFCVIDVVDLESRIRQMKSGAPISAITSHQIEKVKSCHLFTVRKVEGEYWSCAATSHKIVLLKWNPTVQIFVPKKELETNEACSCLMFSSTSLIFGTSKFYSVDLKKFQKRDLLDASDTSLAFAVFGTAQTQSFPIAIFDISHGKPRDEFLLCFSEFGIFVDWQGRRSRKGDLKWKRLPLAFEYHHPHLYITHFNSLAIYQISQDSKVEAGAVTATYVDVPNPRFLGTGYTPDAILLGSSQPDKLEIISYGGKNGTANELSRHTSTLSSISSASLSSMSGPLLDHQGVSYVSDLLKSPSSHSMCSDEETSNTIGQLHTPSMTPRSKRRADNLRTVQKDKNRMSFKMPFSFNKGSK